MDALYDSFLVPGKLPKLYIGFSAFFLWYPLRNFERKKVVLMSSNFDRLHEIKNEAHAENFSCLSHWESKKSSMWASISKKTVLPRDSQI